MKKILTADFADNQRKSRLCSPDSTKSEIIHSSSEQIMGQIRGETKPSKRSFALQADQTYLFTSEAKRSGTSISVTRRKITWYSVRNAI